MKILVILLKLHKSGYGLVVECVLAKDETRVRFPVAAQNETPSNNTGCFILCGLLGIHRLIQKCCPKLASPDLTPI